MKTVFALVSFGKRLILKEKIGPHIISMHLMYKVVLNYNLT